jgi:hypothetical protein
MFCLVQCRDGSWVGWVARLQGLACPSPSCPSQHGHGKTWDRERAESSVARAAKVWGRAAVLERVQHLVGGCLDEGGVRERKCKIW